MWLVTKCAVRSVNALAEFQKVSVYKGKESAYRSAIPELMTNYVAETTVGDIHAVLHTSF